MYHYRFFSASKAWKVWKEARQTFCNWSSGSHFQVVTGSKIEISPSSHMKQPQFPTINKTTQKENIEVKKSELVPPIQPRNDRNDRGISAPCSTVVTRIPVTPTLDVSNNMTKQSGMVGSRVLHSNRSPQPKTRGLGTPKPPAKAERDGGSTDKIPDDLIGKEKRASPQLKNKNEQSTKEVTVQCITCLKFYEDASNSDTACVFHNPAGRRMQVGSAVEVWSCCGRPDGHQGCQRGYHIPLQWCQTSYRIPLHWEVREATMFLHCDIQF